MVKAFALAATIATEAELVVVAAVMATFVITKAVTLVHCRRELVRRDQLFHPRLIHVHWGEVSVVRIGES